jgi:hypothetical protein
MDIMAPRLRYLFNRCMREGVYLRIWRTDMLVLLRKEGRPLDSPSGYRPICLLDEVGKLLERVIAARLEAHMTKREPAGTAANTDSARVVQRWMRKCMRGEERKKWLHTWE